MLVRLLNVISILMSFLGLLVFSFGVFLGCMAYSTKSWPAAGALIIASEVVEVHTGTGFSYRPSVKYKYTVNGEEYTGTSIRFIDFNHWDHAAALRVIELFSTGKEVRARFHKNYPKMTVLDPGAHASDLLVPVAGIVLIMAAFTLRYVRKRLLRQQSQSSSMASNPTAMR